MKKKMLIMLIALMAVLALSANAFAYTCSFGDPSSDEHLTNWLSAWISDPANADEVKAALAAAKTDLTEVYGCAEGEKYPAEYFDSEAQYLNAYCWFAAMDEYYEHEALDYRILNCEAYGIDHEDINIFINDAFLHYDDVAPIIKDSRTMVPFRLIFNALGMQVNYDHNTKTITATDAAKKISFALGSADLTVIENGVEKHLKMDVLPFAENGRTFVPVRFISEAYGWDVYWDSTNKAVVILDKQSYIDTLNIGFEEINALAADKSLHDSFVKALAAYRGTASGNAVKHYAGDMLMNVEAEDISMQADYDINLYSEGSDRLLYEMDINVTMSDGATTVTQADQSKIYADLANGNKYTYSVLNSESAGIPNLWIKEAYDASPYDALMLAMDEQTDLGLEMSREVFRITTIGQDIFKTVIGDGSAINVFTFRDLLSEEYAANFMLFNNESVSLEGKTIILNATEENLAKALAAADYPFDAVNVETEMQMTIYIAEDDSAWGYTMSMQLEEDAPVMMEAEYGAEKIEYKISVTESGMLVEIAMTLKLQEETSAFPEVFSSDAVIMPAE